MIRIRQIGKEGQGDDPAGLREYEVGINNHPAIATFKHIRGDGLAECLRKAAAAVDKASHEQTIALCNMFEAEKGSPATPGGRRR